MAQHRVFLLGEKGKGRVHGIYDISQGSMTESTGLEVKYSNKSNRVIMNLHHRYLALKEGKKKKKTRIFLENTPYNTDFDPLEQTACKRLLLIP